MSGRSKGNPACMLAIVKDLENLQGLDRLIDVMEEIRLFFEPIPGTNVETSTGNR